MSESVRQLRRSTYSTAVKSSCKSAGTVSESEARHRIATLCKELLFCVHYINSMNEVEGGSSLLISFLGASVGGLSGCAVDKTFSASTSMIAC
jgi:hypothetical protein